jgi:hypothetical protein
LWVASSLVLLVACSDEKISACIEQDDPSGFAFTVAPCVDAGCTEIEAWPWRPMPTGQKWSGSADLECVVADSGNEGARAVWLLGSCTGAQAPPSGAVAIEWQSAPATELPLTVGRPVQLSYASEHDGLYRWDEAWTLRDETGVLAGVGKVLDPLSIEYGDMSCSRQIACGGSITVQWVRLSLGGESVTVQHQSWGILASDPLYTLIVAQAERGEGFWCGAYSSFFDYHVAVIRGEP